MHTFGFGRETEGTIPKRASTLVFRWVKSPACEVTEQSGSRRFSSPARVSGRRRVVTIHRATARLVSRGTRSATTRAARGSTDLSCRYHTLFPFHKASCRPTVPVAAPQKTPVRKSVTAFRLSSPAYINSGSLIRRRRALPPNNKRLRRTKTEERSFSPGEIDLMIQTQKSGAIAAGIARENDPGRKTPIDISQRRVRGMKDCSEIPDWPS